MKKHVTIYIDDGVWEAAKEDAWEGRISASKFIEDLLRLAHLRIGSESKAEKVDVEPPVEIVEKAKEKKIEVLKSMGFFNPSPKKGGGA